MELTYIRFLGVFLLVPLSLLVAVVTVRPNQHRPPLWVRASGVSVLAVLALAYTTPWDNHLIDVGVWWYGDGRVAGRIWLAPIEEYLFILLQSVLVSVWTFHLAGPIETSVTQSRTDAVLGAAAGVGISLAGLGFLIAPESTFYLGAILAWAGPVLALQWMVGWRYLLAVRRRVTAAIAVPAAYLGVADWIAIRNGIWTISPDHTTGLALAGLPVEEGVFFLLTSTFVVQGLVLLRWVIARWE
jgi:lycopene cyclase domain-containing protein